MKAIQYVYRLSKRTVIALIICLFILSLSCGSVLAAEGQHVQLGSPSGRERMGRISPLDLLNTAEALPTRLGAVQIASLVHQDIA
jgi:hypothetical protein